MEVALRAGTEGCHGLGARRGRLLAQSQQQETQSQAPQEKAAPQPTTSFRGVLIIAGLSSHPNQYPATCLVRRVTPLYQQPSLRYLRVSVLHTHTHTHKRPALVTLLMCQTPAFCPHTPRLPCPLHTSLFRLEVPHQSIKPSGAIIIQIIKAMDGIWVLAKQPGAQNKYV